MSVVVLDTSNGGLRRFFDDVPEIAEQAMVLSINKAARDATNMLRREAYDQIDFPAGYLDQEDRLGVTKRATRGSVEAVITARDRPTSLARFAPRQTPENTRGGSLVVRVKKGHARTLKRAFLVRLKSGNIGLAIRLRQGERLENKREMNAVRLDGNVYLLYGPSVDQVIRTIVEESTDKIEGMVTEEFFRQFTRLSRGN